MVERKQVGPGPVGTEELSLAKPLRFNGIERSGTIPVGHPSGGHLDDEVPDLGRIRGRVEGGEERCREEALQKREHEQAAVAPGPFRVAGGRGRQQAGVRTSIASGMRSRTEHSRVPTRPGTARAGTVALILPSKVRKPYQTLVPPCRL